MEFISIDFETANSSPASPCAVGLVRVSQGEITESLSMLFRPPYPHNWFHEGNIRIHGIRPEDVSDAPEWEEVLPELLLFTDGLPLVAHNASFDMSVLRNSAAAINFDLPALGYACTLAMARKTYNLESYRLNAVAYAVGHEDFQHHDALADSDACARIALDMAARHEVDSLEDLLIKTKQRLKPLVV
ncbi:MAG: 3'-5' exonuclease [Micrococcales bacterium]|jgi:DNA polymerase III subunit epsilon|nr:3'-5' exonuclease [Micrococcales bacterium]MDG1817712.1 3'-5' exonuclease [Aquiluna sp.]